MIELKRSAFIAGGALIVGIIIGYFCFSDNSRYVVSSGGKVNDTSVFFMYRYNPKTGKSEYTYVGGGVTNGWRPINEQLPEVKEGEK